MCFLAHETCSVSGALIQAASGSVAATFFGHTAGYRNADLTVEEVAAHLDAIVDPHGLTVFSDVTDPGAANRDAEGTMVPKPYRPG